MNMILKTINVGYFTNGHAKEIIKDMCSDGWGIDRILEIPGTLDSWVTFYKYQSRHDKIMKLNSVKNSLPNVPTADMHLQMLLLWTEMYGLFLGFYDGVNFRRSDAEILENVTHWQYIEIELE